MQYWASAAFGAFIGVAVGLADSSSLASLITAVVGLIAVYLGLKTVKFGDPDYDGRILCFSAFALLGLLAGKYVLAEGAFQKSAPTMASLIDAGYTRDEAKQIYAQVHFQLKLAETLSAGRTDCDSLNPQNFQSIQALVHALSMSGDTWKEFGAKLTALDPSQQKAIADSVYKIMCGESRSRSNQ